MKSYLPKDELILSWDPENMEKYWLQCQLFDQYALSNKTHNDSLNCDLKSQLAFSELLMSNS